MLQFFRQNTKILAWFFVIALVFIFTVTSFTYSKHDQYAGEIFGKKVSFQEFRVFETMTRLFPPDESIIENPEIAQQFVWQQLMLSREALSKGVDVTDDEVRAKVDELISQNGPKMSEQDYRDSLKRLRTTPLEFEKGVRELIRIQKLVSKQFPDIGEKPSPEVLKKEEEAYVPWISDIYARAKINDYSQRQAGPVS